TSSTSPLASLRSRISWRVAAAIRTSALARATRAVTGLADTSTIRLPPCSSKCVSPVISNSCGFALEGSSDVAIVDAWGRPSRGVEQPLNRKVDSAITKKVACRERTATPFFLPLPPPPEARAGGADTPSRARARRCSSILGHQSEVRTLLAGRAAGEGEQKGQGGTSQGHRCAEPCDGRIDSRKR